MGHLLAAKVPVPVLQQAPVLLVTSRLFDRPSCDCDVMPFAQELAQAQSAKALQEQQQQVSQCLQVCFTVEEQSPNDASACMTRSAVISTPCLPKWVAEALISPTL